MITISHISKALVFVVCAALIGSLQVTPSTASTGGRSMTEQQASQDAHRMKRRAKVLLSLKVKKETDVKEEEKQKKKQLGIISPTIKQLDNPEGKVVTPPQAGNDLKDHSSLRVDSLNPKDEKFKRYTNAGKDVNGRKGQSSPPENLKDIEEEKKAKKKKKSQGVKKGKKGKKGQAVRKGKKGKKSKKGKKKKK